MSDAKTPSPRVQSLIYPPGINKGSTCQELLRLLNLTGLDCAGLGNDYNDVDFLDICGQAYLVQNAPERLKPHYKSVASDRNNGFTEFIRKTFDTWGRGLGSRIRMTWVAAVFISDVCCITVPNS